MKNDAANPIYEGSNVYQFGLTKREAFAIAAMQAILSSPYYSDFCSEPDNKEKPKAAARAALKHSDALLDELEKTND